MNKLLYIKSYKVKCFNMVAFGGICLNRREILFDGTSASMEEGCVELTEPDVIEPYYRPGIDYDGPHRIGGEAKDKPMKDDYQL
jgi:hypothetical protein